MNYYWYDSHDPASLPRPGLLTTSTMATNRFNLAPLLFSALLLLLPFGITNTLALASSSSSSVLPASAPGDDAPPPRRRD